MIKITAPSTPSTRRLLDARDTVAQETEESETSVASTKKLVGSASSRRALTDYDWDAALSNERVVAKGILWKRKGLSGGSACFY